MKCFNQKDTFTFTSKMNCFYFHRTLIVFNFFNIFVYLYVLVNSLHLKRLDVPGPTENGSSVWLFCDYYLEKGTLHSVKWYKNNIEFYRYMTESDDNERKKFFPQNGVNVNISFSNASHVYLESIDLNSEGTYSCEVSTEEVTGFKSIKAEKDLRLYVLPQQKLSLIGVKPFYEIGDIVDISCVSGPSKPPAILAWFVNDQQIFESEQNLNLSSTVRYVDFDGSSISTINISFEISGDSNLISPSLNLKCSSIISQIVGYTFQEIVVEEKGLYIKLINDYSSKINSPNNNLLPQIDHVSNLYQIGNQLNINCTSSKTYPPPFLEWFINNRKVTSKNLINYSKSDAFKSKSTYVFTSTVYDNFANFDHRPMSTVLGLNFTINKRHYQTLDSVLRIKCFSTHAKIILRDDVGLSLFPDGRTTSYLLSKSSNPTNCNMLQALVIQQLLILTTTWL